MSNHQLMFSSDPNWQLILFCSSSFIMSFNSITFNLLSCLWHLGCTNLINDIWHYRVAHDMPDSTSPLKHSLLKNPKEIRSHFINTVRKLFVLPIERISSGSNKTSEVSHSPSNIKHIVEERVEFYKNGSSFILLFCQKWKSAQLFILLIWAYRAITPEETY